jgi:hypothetical protein
MNIWNAGAEKSKIIPPIGFYRCENVWTDLIAGNFKPVNQLVIHKITGQWRLGHAESCKKNRG